MKKLPTLGFWIALLAIVVVATAPTIPTVLTPDDDSAYFNKPNLTCAGSTDAEGDNINYTFRLNPDNLSNAESYNGSQTYYFLNSDDDWVSHQTYCQNRGQGWDLAVIQDATENAVVAGLDDGEGTWIAYNNVSGTFQWYPIGKRLSNYTNWGGGYPDTAVGGYTSIVPAGTWATDAIAGTRDVVCEYFGLNVNETLQSSNSTTYDLSSYYAGYGKYTWDCRACDNNSECSDYTTPQNINIMYFDECTTGDIALNLTFINETDLTSMDGVINSLTLTFDSDDSGDYEYTDTVTTATDEILYCLNPDNVDISTTGTISYSASGFPQRSFSISETFNGNTTIHKPLYLLPTADGIYTTFQVIDAGNSPIQGVTVVAEKLISGSYTTIGGGSTDNAGSFTIWVDPDTQHRFTFSKTGYTSSIQSIVPTQSSYTVSMGGSTETNETNYNLGILFGLTPRDSVLNLNTFYNFGFNISSDYWNLSSYGFTLRNSTTTLIDTSAGTATGSYVNQSYNTTANSKLYMDYYWIVDGNSQNGTKTWSVRNVTQGDFSMMNFFDDLKNFNQEGFDGFSMALVFIFILVIIIGLIYSTATDIIQMEYAVLGSIVLLVWLGEYTEMLQPIGQQYFITIIAGLIFLAYAIQDNIR